MHEGVSRRSQLICKFFSTLLGNSSSSSFTLWRGSYFRDFIIKNNLPGLTLVWRDALSYCESTRIFFTWKKLCKFCVFVIMFIAPYKMHFPGFFFWVISHQNHIIIPTFFKVHLTHFTTIKNWIKILLQGSKIQCQLLTCFVCKIPPLTFVLVRCDCVKFPI